MKSFDRNLGGWCEAHGISYTRYCDDLAFSADHPLYSVYEKAKAMLEEMGFALNARKTRFVSNAGRQSITGLTVNEKVSVSRDYRRQLRQEIYYVLKFGAADAILKAERRNFICEGKPDAERYLQHLIGKVQFVLQIEPGNRWFENAKIVLRKEIEKENQKMLEKAELKEIRKPHFFYRSADEVASDLLGKFICRKFDDGTVLHWCITETEAYDDSEAVTYKNNMFRGVGEWCPYNGMIMINCTTEQGSDNVLIRALDCVKGPYKIAETLKIKEIKSEITKQGVIDHEKLWLDDFGFTVDINRQERIGIIKKLGIANILKRRIIRHWQFIFRFLIRI